MEPAAVALSARRHPRLLRGVGAAGGLRQRPRHRCGRRRRPPRDQRCRRTGGLPVRRAVGAGADALRRRRGRIRTREAAAPRSDDLVEGSQVAMLTVDVLVALTPVVVFLTALWLMDSFTLVRVSAILGALGFGAVAAGACLWLHAWLMHAHQIPVALVTRYIAPLTEETAKALLIVLLIATGRVGFLVDVALEGFAVGTGFALVENL